MADKNNYLCDESDEIIIRKAIEVLGNNLNFQKEASLKYRQFFVEELEKTLVDERQMIQLLSIYYGEFMFTSIANHWKSLNK